MNVLVTVKVEDEYGCPVLDEAGLEALEQLGWTYGRAVGNSRFKVPMTFLPADHPHRLVTSFGVLVVTALS